MNGIVSTPLSSASGCALLLVFLIHLSPVSSLFCTHCQHFDPGCRYGDYEARECDDPNSTHCYVVHLFLRPRAYGTFRGCTIRPNDNEVCRPVRVGNYTGTGCLEVCDWDRCNSGIRHPRPWET